MYTSRLAAAVVAACTLASPALAQERSHEIGTPVSAEDLKPFFSIQPGGIGLPAGSGTVAHGREAYNQRCFYCHGEKLEGNRDMAGPPLAGGRGTLASEKPLKTVESYWPQASTLFDYIWRAMPFDQPGSLTADEVYSLVAYILAEGKIVGQDVRMDAETLSKVVMPNANGFYDGSGPDLRIYRAGADK